MNNQDTALIERYFAGLLSEEEKLAFEKRLGEDKVFLKLFEEEKLLRKGIEYGMLKDAEKQLQSLEAGLPALKSAGKRAIIFYKSRVFLRIAAVLLLILISIVVILTSRQTNIDDLIAEYNEPYPNEVIPTRRSANITDLNLKDQAFYQYDLGNYSDAVQLFERLLKGNQDDDVQFYLANAYFATGSYRKAIENYQQYLNGRKDFETQARWYIALSYLNINDTEKSCFHLSKVKGDAYYINRAIKLNHILCK